MRPLRSTYEDAGMLMGCSQHPEVWHGEVQDNVKLTCISFFFFFFLLKADGHSENWHL